MKTNGMNDKSVENVLKKFEKLSIPRHELIERSFLNQKLKENYYEMIERKFDKQDLNKWALIARSIVNNTPPEML